MQPMSKHRSRIRGDRTPAAEEFRAKALHVHVDARAVHAAMRRVLQSEVQDTSSRVKGSSSQQ